jgi:hypothetical protein
MEIATGRPSESAGMNPYVYITLQTKGELPGCRARHIYNRTSGRMDKGGDDNEKAINFIFDARNARFRGAAC